MTDISYLYINELLERYNLASDAAECHGALSAVLCIMGESGFDVWSQQHLPEITKVAAEGDALAKQTCQLFKDWYEQVELGLKGDDFDYSLMLPDDDELLEDRLEGLSHWCQGFILGLSLAGLTKAEDISEEIGELVKDIGDMSLITSNDDSGSEATQEEENDFMELVEYLRVGVMLFYETLQHQADSENTTYH